MGKEWDKFKIERQTKSQVVSWLGSGMRHNRNEMPAYQQFTYKWALEVLRILKPGGYLLSFGGTRTYHRMTCAIEDAGFEIRDCIMWLYGSGFPKSLNIGKAILKQIDRELKKQGVIGEIVWK